MNRLSRHRWIIALSPLALAACSGPAETVPRNDLVDACVGWDYVMELRREQGDTLGTDRAGQPIVLEEEIYQRAEQACSQVTERDWSQSPRGPQ